MPGFKTLPTLSKLLEQLRPKTRSWLLLSACLTLFTACSSGPRVPVCLFDVGKKELDCNSKKTGPFIVEHGKFDDYPCFDPDDFSAILKACVGRAQLPTVETCLYDSKSDVFACSDGKLLPYPLGSNYVCFTGQDFSLLVDYCRRRRGTH